MQLYACTPERRRSHCACHARQRRGRRQGGGTSTATPPPMLTTVRRLSSAGSDQPCPGMPSKPHRTSRLHCRTPAAAPAVNTRYRSSSSRCEAARRVLHRPQVKSDGRRRHRAERDAASASNGGRWARRQRQRRRRTSNRARTTAPATAGSNPPATSRRGSCQAWQSMPEPAPRLSAYSCSRESPIIVLNNNLDVHCSCKPVRKPTCSQPAGATIASTSGTWKYAIVCRRRPPPGPSSPPVVC